MNAKYFLITFILTMGSLSAQSFIGKLNPLSKGDFNTIANDTLRILAVMVNFQEDKDGATFGNGKFGSIYTQEYGYDILDPLPHDKTYFENHLKFVKNYFNKVSKGKLEVNFDVLPDTFSVSKTMRNYSPPPGSDDYKPVGEFAKEVWIKAAQLNQSINFSDYDIFLIFHAGVGRDISLPGSIGNERDLPSFYLSENALKEIFNNDLTGFPLNRFGKTNSMIIPETESRELETISGKFLFEITINGLLVASIASHLGLPDLFDTETGLSAIGRFGLMDGQSIFAYNGCFPPEPSAWEKIYLGWSEPIEIQQQNSLLNLAANLSATLNDTVIIKVPINSSEYYLIENRQRDVKDKGANLTYVVNGNLITRRFDDTTGFYSYDTDSLSGVVIDVDEFDWALPGNGIVIWHIDESVINEKLAENKINVDKNRRGVDVEEADGIQDIGEKYITVFGDEVIGEGTEEDFWFNGNKAELFKNIFNKESRPNTLTNTGANSLITIKDFSANSSKMSFNIEFGDSIIKPLFSIALETNLPVRDITFFNKGIFSEFIFRTDSALILHNLSGFPNNIYWLKTSVKPATVVDNNTDFLFQPVDSLLYVIMQQGSVTKSVNVNDIISTSPIVTTQSNGTHYVILGTKNGRVLVYTSGTTVQDPQLVNEIVLDTSLSINKIAGNGDYFSFICESQIASIPPSPSTLYFDNLGNSFSFTGEKPIDLAVTKDKNGKFISIVLTDQNKFYILSEDKLLNTFIFNSTVQILSFILTDLKNDGNVYIVFNNQHKVEAINISGAAADNFPYVNSNDIQFISTPLAIDFEGDKKSELLTFTNNGSIIALNGANGKIIDGFPISTGVKTSTVPILFSNENSPSLAVIDENNILSSWKIGNVDGNYFWSEKNGNSQNSRFVNSPESSSSINEFFPTSRAYNYPNPVYDGQTAIRYFVNEDSKVNIKIFDIAGDFVAELNSDAQGGLDNETIWNVENIQSGVYLARIEAKGLSGKTESVVIKIAVVK